MGIKELLTRTLGIAIALLISAWLAERAVQPSAAEVASHPQMPGKPQSYSNQSSLDTPAATPTCERTWQVVPSPIMGHNYNHSLEGVVAISTNDAWAVGHYRQIPDGPYQTLILHWDGYGWNVVPSPNPNSGDNYLYGLAAVSANDVWAVGYNWDTLTMHWNGTQWSVVSSANAKGQNWLRGVAALSANDVWAVGYRLEADDSDFVTLVEHWDGTQWSVVDSPNLQNNNNLYGVAAVSSSDVWAVGNYGRVLGGEPDWTLVERYYGA